MNRYGAFRTLAKFALILTAVVVAQGILSLRLRVFNYFDLPLIYSIYYGFTLANPAGSIAIGSVLGLMQDSMSGATLGTNGFTKTLIGFLSASAVTKFDVEQPITRSLALVSFTFLDLAIKGLLSLLANAGSGSVQVFGLGVGFWVLSAVFNVLFGLILFGYRSRFGHVSA
jgi:rod shape-determining protein MreD